MSFFLPKMLLPLFFTQLPFLLSGLDLKPLLPKEKFPNFTTEMCSFHSQHSPQFEIMCVHIIVPCFVYCLTPSSLD